jgi:hypothetical protein
MAQQSRMDLSDLIESVKALQQEVLDLAATLEEYQGMKTDRIDGQNATEADQ